MTSLKLIADIKIIEANLEFGEKTEIQEERSTVFLLP